MAEGVIFTPGAARRIGDTVRKVDGAGGDLRGRRRLPPAHAVIRYGKPIEAVSESVATVTLDPCDVNGNDIAGVQNVVVRTVWDGIATVVNLATGDVVPFVSFPLEATDDETRGLLLAVPTGETFLGSPTELYTSGATITLNPVDSAGVDNSRPDVIVQAGWTLPAVTESGIGLNIPTSAIIPFRLAADGKYYVIGQPKQIVTGTNFDTTTHYLQQKIRFDFGAFTSTESEWQNVQDFVDCTAV